MKPIKPIKKLIMLSGGVDSALMAYDCLKNNESIHLHHVHITNSENRTFLEAKAVDDILNYFNQHFSPALFSISYSVWKESDLGCIGRDYMVYLLAAQRIAIYLAADYQVQVHVGFIKEDCKSIAVQEGWDLRLWRTIIETDVNSFRKSISKDLYRPVLNLSKLNILQRLPKELIDLCWSCRRPVDDKVCGKCRSCKELNKAKRKLK